MSALPEGVRSLEGGWRCPDGHWGIDGALGCWECPRAANDPLPTVSTKRAHVVCFPTNPETLKNIAEAWWRARGFVGVPSTRDVDALAAVFNPEDR